MLKIDTAKEFKNVLDQVSAFRTLLLHIFSFRLLSPTPIHNRKQIQIGTFIGLNLWTNWWNGNNFPKFTYQVNELFCHENSALYKSHSYNSYQKLRASPSLIDSFLLLIQCFRLCLFAKWLSDIKKLYLTISTV